MKLKCNKPVLELFVERNNDKSSIWNFLTGRKKDTSDYDWEIILSLFHHQFIWLFAHLIICEYLRWRNHDKLIPFAQITITVSYLIFNFRIPVLLVILVQPILFEIFSKFKEKRILWLCEIISLILLHIYSRFFPHTYNHMSHLEHVMIVQTLFWINLRCVSYTISKTEKNATKTDFVAILSYCLYLPLFSNGPFVSINDFIQNKYPINTTFSKRIIGCCINIIRFVFWIIVTEFLLHYIYVSSISYYPMV